ncbi:MAG: hypothetical protein LQ351_007773 [Letrouitia transgressa]|nr:MAG: hypothetical protein LQ351_007773 [Letrouitia transgressa]
MLSIDTQYSDEYSECSSSNSSFACDPLTPASSLSSHSSRRQSFNCDTELQSNIAAGPQSLGFPCDFQFALPGRPATQSYHRTGVIALQMAGYDLDQSSTFTSSSSNRSTASTSLSIDDPFVMQAADLCTTVRSSQDVELPRCSLEDLGFTTDQRVSINIRSDSPEAFDYSFTGREEENQQPQNALGVDFRSELNSPLRSPYPGLQSSCVRGFATPNYSSEPTMTIAPRETVMCPGTPPENRCLAAPYQPPVLKLETSPHLARLSENVGLVETDNIERSTFDVRYGMGIDMSFDEGIEDEVSPRYRKFQRPKKAIFRSRLSTEPYICETYKYSSEGKQHHCVECNIKFDRPEHCNRHKDTMMHRERLKQLGKPLKEVKMYPCIVPKCGKELTRNDNLKAHYQNTHLFDKNTNSKKRREYVSIEQAEVLGLAQFDPRRADYAIKDAKKKRPTRR